MGWQDFRANPKTLFCRAADGGRAVAIPKRYGVTRNENSWKTGINQTRPSMRFSAGRRKGLERDSDDFRRPGTSVYCSLAALLASRSPQRHKPFMAYTPFDDLDLN